MNARSLVLARFVSAFAVLAGLPLAAWAQGTPSQPSRPSIVSAGQAVVRRAPDRAFVRVTAESRAAKPAEAQRTNAATMTAVLAKLVASGIPKEAVRTASYTVEPEYDFTNNRRTLRGYVARNSVEVRIDDLERVGEVMDAVVSSGATSVGDVRFDLKDRAAAEREALRLAVADARARAEALAAGAGLTVGAVLLVQEERTEIGIPRPMPEMMAMRAEASTPVSPGEIEIRGRVTLTLAIK